MEWITVLFREDSVAHAVLILSLVIALGLGLGSVRVFGISLGVAGVLFSGLIFGHLGLTIHHEVLEFAREFGLILFVFTIGLQVGPGFFASLKRQGLSMNLLAASIVVFGALITVAIHYLAAVSVPAAAGLFSGATTNTPSLAAAGQAPGSVPGSNPWPRFRRAASDARVHQQCRSGLAGMGCRPRFAHRERAACPGY